VDRAGERSSYVRLIDFLYHSTLGSRVIKKRGEEPGGRQVRGDGTSGSSGFDLILFSYQMRVLGFESEV